MAVSNRSAALALLAFVACGGRISETGTGGSSGSFGSGASGGGSGAAASGGSGSIDGSTLGFCPAPVCGEGCRAPGGCCHCLLGDVQNLGGVEYVCEGDCLKLRGDGGGICSTDYDCPYGFFCRLLEDDSKQCFPYVGEGESCGDSAPFPLRTLHRCAPDLVCADEPPLTADAPGTCRVSCVLDTECPPDRYCSQANNVCRDDGACLDDVDCNLVSNNYPRPKCVGSGSCNDGFCTYQCAM